MEVNKARTMLQSCDSETDEFCWSILVYLFGGPTQQCSWISCGSVLRITAQRSWRTICGSAVFKARVLAVVLSRPGKCFLVGRGNLLETSELGFKGN